MPGNFTCNKSAHWVATVLYFVGLSATASVYISCYHITLTIPRLKIKLWPYHVYRQNAANFKEKYQVLTFIDTNTAFLWQTVGWSIVEEARCLLDADMESRNVSPGSWRPGNVKGRDRGLAVSNGCYCTLALSEMKLWLYQKWGWHFQCISVCFWYLALLKVARNGHLDSSKLGIEPWLCQY